MPLVRVRRLSQFSRRERPMSWSGLPAKFEDRIQPEPNSGCWLWLGPLRDSKEGYGGTSWEGKAWRTHRLFYTLLKGPIPDGLAIDHLCRNRICCNPDHLEPTTWKNNIHRGEGIAAKNRIKTHCPQGHELSGANLSIWAGNGSQQRQCRTCSAVHKRNYALKMGKKAR